jgi:hypothetical protein
MRAASARLFACAVVGTLVSAWSHPVHADTAPTVGIALQPLDAALSEFTHQIGQQLVYVSRGAQACAPKSAHAGLSPAAALRELLDDIGPSFQFVNARTVRIFEPVGAVPTGPSPGRGRAPP